MKEKYLETKKFPKAEIEIVKLTLPEECLKAACTANKIPFEGMLSLHGTKKAVNGLAEIKKKEAELEAKFEFKFPLKEFGVETPSFMGISVTQDVAVTASLNGPLVKQ